MKTIIFITLLLTSFACIRQADLPADVINEDKMVEILVDYHTTEQLVAKLPDNFDTLTTQFQSVYFPQMLTKHEISREQFFHSYSYYCTDLKRFEEIYSKVENTLQSKGE